VGEGTVAGDNPMLPRLDRGQGVFGPDVLAVTRSRIGPIHVLGIALFTLTALLLSILILHRRVDASPGVILAAVILGMFAVLLAAFVKPFHSLLFTLVFLASPFPLLLGNTWSGLIAGGLLGISILGTALRSSFSRITWRDPLLLLSWAFVTYGALSAVRGLWEGNPLPWVVGDLFQVLEFAFGYILVSALVTRADAVYRLLKWLGVTVVVTIVFELAIPLLGLNALLPSWEGTVSRTIDMGALFLLVMLLTLYSVNEQRTWRLWVWILLIPTAMNILLSLTRGLWVSSIVAVSASALLLRGRARWHLLRTFAVLAVVAVLSAAAVQVESGGSSLFNVFEERVAWGQTQVEQGLTGEESLATRRFMEFVIISPELLTAPVLGKGLGATYAIGSFAVLDAGNVDVIDHHYIHNLFLMVAFRMGAIGLFLFVWILYRYFRDALAACLKLPGGVNQALVVGLFASVFGQAVLSMTWPTILDHPTSGITGCAMALTFGISRLALMKQGSPERTRPPGA
jgi:hypothetical protein